MELEYKRIQNLLIYSAIKRLRPEYSKKAVPDYIHNPLSYLDIPCLRMGAEAAPGTDLVKIFFAEQVLDGRRFREESLVSEKDAILNLGIEMGLYLLRNNQASVL